jgi:hypothetical protein
MSLDKSVLKASILQMINDGYTTVSAAANAWADAYDIYANGTSSFAQDQSTDRVTTVSKSALASGLISAFSGTSASGAASGIESAVIAYWTGGVFGITTPPTLLDPMAISDISAVVNNPGSGLASALLSIFGANKTDADASADQVATAFDTHAKTVKVLCTYLATLPSPPFITTKTITLSVS